MPKSPLPAEGLVEVIAPDRPSYTARITEFPFLIGRGADSGNHLQLSGRHVSRCAAAIVFVDAFYVEDRGQRSGVLLNGTKIARHALRDGDVITFGHDNAHRVIFRTAASSASVEQLLTHIESITRGHSSPGNLDKINLLLEATMLLQSELPLDAVLATMLDHAIAVTKADRSFLLEADADASLQVKLARGGNGSIIDPREFSPSQTALRIALERRSSVVTADVREADAAMQAAESIVAQNLRSVVVIPLYARLQRGLEESTVTSMGRLLGVLYLDSRRTAAFSSLDRQILDAIAAEAASILENARLVEHERERRRLEQEVGIAREIQQALLPSGFRDFPHLTVTGINWPCLGVGGDYFDVFPLTDSRTAFLIADVSGKGLGAALLTTMLQGALSGMKMGADPASVFSHINAFLCEHSDVGRYATMFFAVLDRDGSLEFINAGHPSPLLLRAGDIYEPFSEGCLPVGLIDNAQYASAATRLQPDDVLVMFSDGVTEAMDTEESLFGISRLREALSGKSAISLEELQRTILESVQAFSQGADQADDITLMLARYRSPA